MSDGAVELPLGERIIHKSEVFQARIVDKTINTGITKDTFLLRVVLLDNDPLIERDAWVMVEKDIYYLVNKGEEVGIRLYEQPDGKWTKNPPIIVGSL